MRLLYLIYTAEVGSPRDLMCKGGTVHAPVSVCLPVCLCIYPGRQLSSVAVVVAQIRKWRHCHITERLQFGHCSARPCRISSPTDQLQSLPLQATHRVTGQPSDQPTGILDKNRGKEVISVTIQCQVYVYIYVYIYIVTCTAFPHVTLHSQPFPITRLVAVLCYTCYFVPPNGLGALPICLCSCDAP